MTSLPSLPDFLVRDDGGFVRLAGSRIGLHQVVRLYRDGHSPEEIVETLPTLSLVQIHKCIVFYLENAAAAEEYQSEQERAFEQVAASLPKSGPDAEELRRRFEIAVLL